MLKRICGIYKIINLINGKYYVGSSANISRRFRLHLWQLKKGNHDNIRLQHSFNKYGEKAFVLKIIEECIEQNLLIREQYWMGLLDPIHSGYNINEKADRPPSWKGKKHSDITKKKISLGNKGKKLAPWHIAIVSKTHKGKIISDEHKKILSEKNSGENNPMYGRTVYDTWEKRYGKKEADRRWKKMVATNKRVHKKFRGKNNPACRPEVRKLISDTNRGRVLCSPEAIERMRKTKTGVKLSSKTKMKMSLKRRGEKNGSSKLSDVDRMTIIHQVKNGASATNLAHRYGVSRRSIYNARGWKYASC